MFERWSNASLAKFGFWFIIVELVILSMILPWFATANSPSKSVEDTDISGLTITIIWDTQPVQDQSTHVEVYIHGPIQKTFSSNEAKDFIVPEQTSTQLTSVGTPNVPMQKVLGSHYNIVNITAQFSASAFDGVYPIQTQSINQQQVHFTWVATPKFVGKQVINVTVTGTWIPQNSGPSIERPLAEHLLHILVAPTPANLPPFIVPGQFTLSELILAVINALLTGSWVWECIKRIKNGGSSSTSTVPAPILTLVASTSGTPLVSNSTSTIPAPIPTPVASTSGTPLASNSTSTVPAPIPTPVASTSGTPLASNSTGTVPAPILTLVVSTSVTPLADNSTGTVPAPIPTPVASTSGTPLANNSTGTVPTPIPTPIASTSGTLLANNSTGTVPAPSPPCASLTKKGNQCKNKAKEGSKYCWRHEPKDAVSNVTQTS